MALAIQKIMLWRAEVDNRSGALATTLEFSRAVRLGG